MFRDNAKILELSEIKPRTYHGHTRIELKDVRTGRRDRIESDNTFQSAVLAKYLRSLGIYNNIPWGNQYWAAQDLWRNLVGGILLFDSIIPANSEYMPAGTKMIANGCYGVASLSNAELGSYNERESVIENGNITMVYDYGTSQANGGSINSVCLCSEVGGYIGYGNQSGISVTAKNMDALQNSNTRQGIPYKNVLYTFEIDDTLQQLTVTKKRAAVTQASIFDGMIETKTFDYGTSIGMGQNPNTVYAKYMANGKIIIMYLTGYSVVTWSVEYMKFLVYDIENDTVTRYSLQNPTGGLPCITMQSINLSFAADENYIYIPTYNNPGGSPYLSLPVYKIAISDGSLDDSFLGGTIGGDLFNLSPGLFRFGQNILDSITGEVAPANMNSQALHYIDDADALLSCTSDNMGLVKNPLYLATINNLESPVTKMSTQTMKVTYTLTEV